MPFPLPLDAIAVDSSQLQLRKRAFEILAGELGDTVLSITVSIIISEVEKNEFEWINGEIEFIDYRMTEGDREDRERLSGELSD